MNKLERMQQYADKIADKLGVETRPVLRWSGGDCIVPARHNAHCHVVDSKGFKRGTICFRKGNYSTNYLHYIIAHEVAHLATKSGHSSSTFAKKMVTAGCANKMEQLRAKQGKRHRHIYNTHYYHNGELVYSTCFICHKRKYH